MDTEIKVAWQALLQVWENNTDYLYGYRLLKNEEFKNWKDFKAQKNYLVTNNNNKSWNES